MFSVKLQPRKMHLTLWIIVVLRKEKVQHGMLINLMDFNHFGCLFEKVTWKSSINNRFYKGLFNAFLPLRKVIFTNDSSSFCTIANAYHIMLINSMGFNELSALSVKFALKSMIFHRFYKAFATGWPHVAKHWFCRGFHDLFRGALGASRARI